MTTQYRINKFGPNLANSLTVAILKNALLLPRNVTEYLEIAPRYMSSIGVPNFMLLIIKCPVFSTVLETNYLFLSLETNYLFLIC